MKVFQIDFIEKDDSDCGRRLPAVPCAYKECLKEVDKTNKAQPRIFVKGKLEMLRMAEISIFRLMSSDGSKEVYWSHRGIINISLSEGEIS